MKSILFTVTNPDGSTANFKVSYTNVTDAFIQGYVIRFRKQFPKSTVTWKEVT